MYFNIYMNSVSQGRDGTGQNFVSGPTWFFEAELTKTGEYTITCLLK